MVRFWHDSPSVEKPETVQFGIHFHCDKTSRAELRDYQGGNLKCDAKTIFFATNFHPQ